jgi:hypothetical protein
MRWFKRFASLTVVLAPLATTAWADSDQSQASDYQGIYVARCTTALGTSACQCAATLMQSTLGPAALADLVTRYGSDIHAHTPIAINRQVNQQCHTTVPLSFGDWPA